MYLNRQIYFYLRIHADINNINVSVLGLPQQLICTSSPETTNTYHNNKKVMICHCCVYYLFCCAQVAKKEMKNLNHSLQLCHVVVLAHDTVGYLGQV